MTIFPTSAMVKVGRERTFWPLVLAPVANRDAVSDGAVGRVLRFVDRLDADDLNIGVAAREVAHVALREQNLVAAETEWVPSVTSGEPALPPESEGLKVGIVARRSYDVGHMLREDIVALRSVRGRVLPMVFPSLFAVAAYRFAVQLRARGFATLARGVCAVAQAVTGAELDPLAQIGPGLVLEHTHGVVIGPGVVAGARLRLFGGALLGNSFNAAESKRPHHGFPTLGDDVLVLAKASVIGPVTIGDSAVVAAHALVLDDVPAGAKAIGAPARTVGRDS